MTQPREYELVFIAHPELDDGEGVPALTAKVRGWIEGAGGEVTHTALWGRRKLAYPIRKQLEGSYVLMRALLPRQALGELERELKLSEQILRYLLVRAETPPSELPVVPESAGAPQLSEARGGAEEASSAEVL